MNKTKVFAIQLHAVMSLLGYWFFHAMVFLALGASSTMFSIIYDAIQLSLALYVIIICNKDIAIERGCTELSFFSLLIALYAIRMLFDMGFGPFVGQVSTAMFLSDMLYTIGGTFVSVWAIIISRKYIDIDKIVRLVFWMGLAAIVAVLLRADVFEASDAYEEERMTGGQGLGTLALAKLGAIVAIASIHLLFNKEKRRVKKVFYIIGLILGVWLSLASGSRGAVAALVIALGLYFIFSTRRNPVLIAVAVVSVAFVVINIVPILTWLSDFFPVFGRRMLATLLEDDQGGRQAIRRQAWEVTINHPLLGYSYRLFGTESGFRAHNGILEVSIALGIPITLLFIFFVYVKGLLMALKNMVNRKLLFPTTLGVFALVSSMTSSSISNSEFDFAFCILVISCYYNSIKSQITNG